MNIYSNYTIYMLILSYLLTTQRNLTHSYLLTHSLIQATELLELGCKILLLLLALKIDFLFKSIDDVTLSRVIG
jgi:hypothetical protein